MGQRKGAPPDTVDAVLCLDANLPKLPDCEKNCSSTESVLCTHRFNLKADIVYCNVPKFQGRSDYQVCVYFLSQIIAKIAEGKVNANQCFFMLLTKDRNFIEDVEMEWRSKRKRGEDFMEYNFSGNYITIGNVVIIVQQVDCFNYGTNRKSDLRCIFKKVNSFFYNSVDSEA